VRLARRALARALEVEARFVVAFFAAPVRARVVAALRALARLAMDAFLTEALRALARVETLDFFALAFAFGYVGTAKAASESATSLAILDT
jgi:hypothetical protein